MLHVSLFCVKSFMQPSWMPEIHFVSRFVNVRTMLDMGLSAETVASKIAASACRFDTSLDSLRQLQSAGVPEMVIRAMVKGGAR